MFAKYVRFETISRATFNYWEPSLLIEKGRKKFIVYITKYPFHPEPNLVVIEAWHNREELYFRAFLGKHGGECETEKETQNFYKQLKKTISPEFRVKGTDLEKRILNLLDEVDKGQFSN